MPKITFLLNGLRPTPNKGREYTIYFRCVQKLDRINSRTKKEEIKKIDKETGEEIIKIKYSYYYKWINVNTALNPKTHRITPDLWDKNSQRIIIPASTRRKKYMSDEMFVEIKHMELDTTMQYEKINIDLFRIENHFKNFFRDAEWSEKQLSTELVKQELNKLLLGKTRKDITLLSFIDDYIKSQEKIKAPGTIKNYKVAQKRLLDFNDKIYPIDFRKMTKSFANAFIEWCLEDGLSANYINRLLKQIKLFMNEAYLEELTNINIKENKYFSIKTTETVKIYLSEKELESMLDLNLEGTMKLSRDLFVIGAYTGMRISDFNNLNDSVIEEKQGVRLLRYIAKKTGKQSVAPVNEIVWSLYNEYKGNPPYIADQTINENLKKIAEKAGINDEVLIVEKGNKSKVKKFKLVTSHTARRSFATNQYLKGANLLQIMAATGHSKPITLLNYIKVTNDERVIEMMKKHN